MMAFLRSLFTVTLPFPLSAFLLLVVGLGMVTVDVGIAQIPSGLDSTAMPLALFEGDQYTRQTFAPNGTQEGHQKVTVSRLQRAGDQAMEMEVTSYNHNEDGGVTDTLRTTITCRNDAAQIAMSPYGQTVRRARDGGGPSLSPPGGGVVFSPQCRNGDSSGGRDDWVSGGKSRIHLSDRQVRPTPEGASFTVQETLNMRFYVLGMKVRERTYDLEETIAAPEGVVRLVLRGPEGYQTILEQI